MVDQKTTSKNWKRLAILLKVAVFVLLFWSIYREIAQRGEMGQIWQEFKHNIIEDPFNGNPLGWLLVFGLMPINWGLETKKWQMLIRKVEQLGFVRSLQAICSGITLSMFTPNRTGDFGGRVLLMKNTNRMEGIAMTLVGSLSQLIAALFIGMSSFLCVAHQYLQIKEGLFIAITGIFVGVFLLGLLFYYNLNWVKKIPWLKKWHPYINPAVQYSIKELNFALSLSALRQLVFGLQFWLLLVLLGVNLGFVEGMLLVFSIFFVQTFVPSIAMVELGVRGKIALFFMGNVAANEIAVLSASFLLWGINLLIPALIGAYIIGRTRFFESS